jgi:predicted small metal-binding protein
VGGLRLEPVVARAAMADLKSVRCPCGFEVRSRDEDELVRMTQQHAKTIHGQDVTAEQARALIERVA